MRISHSHKQRVKALSKQIIRAVSDEDIKRLRKIPIEGFRIQFQQSR